MKTRKVISILVLLAAVFAFSRGTYACPGCNVFNYLFTSVRSSPNIVVGKVQKQVGERTALVRIERTLRGTNQPGTMGEFMLYSASNHVGQQFIFSDPTECCPDFPTLPIDGEWEVAFIVRNAPFDPEEPFGFYDMGGVEGVKKLKPNIVLPVVSDAREAVLCIKGVSHATREFGMQYGLTHPKTTLPLLKQELLNWMSNFSRYETDSIADHKLDGLVQAMWKIDEEVSLKFFTEDLTKRFARKPVDIQINEKSRDATLEASFIKSVLEHAKEAGVGEPFRRQTVHACHELRGQALVNVIYALVYSELLSVSEMEETIEKVVSRNADQRLAVGLGYYQLGVEHARWWAREKAREELLLAKTHCGKTGNVQLVAQIDEEIERVNRWLKN